MPQALGSLVVEVAANVARFQSDMGKIAQIAEQRAQQVDKALGIVSTSLKAIGAGFVIGLTLDKIKDKIEGAIASAAGLQQLAERTGATVEGLSGLAAVAKLSGTGADELAGGLQKLSKAMVDAKDGGTKTTSAFNAIGISTNELIGKRPDEAFLLIAKRLATFADGAEKTAIAQVLLGKAGANLLPTMRDLADVGELQTKVTAAQSAGADEYEKNLKRLDAVQGAIFKTIGLALIPTLNEFTKALLDSAKGTDGVRGAVGDLAKDGSIQTWAEVAVQAVGVVISSFQVATRLVEILAKGVGAAAAGSAAFLMNDFDQAKAIFKEFAADADAIEKRVLFSQTLAKRLDIARESADSGPNFGHEGRARPRPDPKFKPNTGGGAANADDPRKKILDGALKVLEAYIATEKTLLGTREQSIDFYRNLDYITLRESETRKQALIADNLVATVAAYDKESAALAIYIAKAAKVTDKQEGRNKLAEVTAKRAAAEVEANKKIGDSQNVLLAVQRQFDLVTQEAQRQAKKSNAAATFQIDVMGLSTLAVLKLSEARRIELELEERIYELRKKDPGADVAEAVAKAEEQKASALALVERGYNKQRDGAFGAQEALRKYAEDAANKGAQIENALTNAFKNAEDALVNFVKTGKIDFRSLADSIISDLIRIQVKGLLGGAAGAGGLSSLFGSFGASFFSGNTGAATGLANALPGDALDNLINLTGGFGTKAANGIPYVPYDGMRAVLHEGERVMTKQENAGASGGGSNVDNRVGTINVGQGVSRGEVQAAIGQALAQQERRLQRLQRQGKFA